MIIVGFFLNNLVYIFKIGRFWWFVLGVGGYDSLVYWRLFDCLIKNGSCF